MVKNVSGQKFGTILVVKKLDVKKGSAFLYETLCDCGNIKQYTANELKHIKSCGCQHYNKPPKDITGNVYGKLTAVSNTMRKTNNGDYIWRCICECGNECLASIGALNFGNKNSCGCLSKDAYKKRSNYHGYTETSEYKSWLKIKERCLDHNCPTFKNYGAKGITICDEWANSFKRFITDMGEMPVKGYTVDRIDSKKGYSPDNCRWASRYVQSRNRSSNIGTSSYKGVQYEESSGKWLATITVGSLRCKKIGRYRKEYHAATAYNLATIMIFGEGSPYTVLNDVCCDYSVVNTDCKFFNVWVDEMKKEKEKLYEQEGGYK